MKPDNPLTAAFIRTHPDDAARLLERHSTETARRFLEALRPELAAIVMLRMVSTMAAACLTALPPDKAAPILAGLEAQQAAQLLRVADEAAAASLIRRLPTGLQLGIRLLLRYPERTLGALMNPLALPLSDDLTTTEARERLAGRKKKPPSVLFIATRGKKLAGHVHISDLYQAKDTIPLKAIMAPAPVSLPARATVVATASHPAWEHFHELPVVETDGTLVGTVSYQQIKPAARDTVRENGAAWRWLLMLAELYGLAAAATFSASVGLLLPEERDKT